MIHVKLKDGTTRPLDEAKVTLVWKNVEDEEQAVADGGVGASLVEDHTYDLSDVVKFIMVEPMVYLAPGVGGGMPLVALAFRDTSDLAFEAPMPAAFALDLAERLPVECIEAEKMANDGKPLIARTMPGVLQQEKRAPSIKSRPKR